MGDRIAVMREGVLQQAGTPEELYTRPANLFVACFIGSPAMNLVPVEAASENGSAALRSGDLVLRVPERFAGEASRQRPRARRRASGPSTSRSERPTAPRPPGSRGRLGGRVPRRRAARPPARRRRRTWSRSSRSSRASRPARRSTSRCRWRRSTSSTARPSRRSLGLSASATRRRSRPAPRPARAAASGASCGRYQFQRPSRCMVAGSTTERMIVASISSATATPKPICWNMISSPLAKPANTATMISAAPVMIRAVEATPKTTACVVGSSSPGRPGRELVVALLDPAEQEDLVVHREAEQDGEQEERHPGLDRVHLVEAEETGPEPVLEDQHEQPVRGADREQVEQHRGRRDHQRAEHDVRKTSVSPSTSAITQGAGPITESK